MRSAKGWCRRCSAAAWCAKPIPSRHCVKHCENSEQEANRTCSREVGQVTYLGISEGSDPIRRVIDETQISRVLHAGCRNRVIYDIAARIARGDCSDLDLVGNTDRQQTHQLSVADIGDERDPGEAQQARRVGGGQYRAMEFLLDEVEITLRRTGLAAFVRLRVLPLAGRAKTGVVTSAPPGAVTSGCGDALRSASQNATGLSMTGLCAPSLPFATIAPSASTMTRVAKRAVMSEVS